VAKARQRTPEEENEALRARLAEAEETIQAIREGAVDAIIGDKDQVFTLTGADQVYRLVVEQMRGGVVTFTQEGQILYCNRQFALIVGTPMEHLIGSSLLNFIPSAFMNVFKSLISQPGEADLYLREGNGLQVPVRLSVNRLELPDSTVHVAVVNDLTEQQRNARLAADAQVLNSLISRAQEVLLICDEVGRVTHTSNVANQLVGPGWNRTCDSFLKSFSFHDKPITLADLRSERVQTGSELTHVRDDRQEFYLLSYGNFLTAGHEMGGIIGLVDITKLKKAEAALRESQENFSRLFNAMTEGIATHRVVYDKTNRAVDYVILDVNPSYEEITGISRDKAVGRKATDLYGAGEAPYLDIYARVAAGGGPVSFETYFPPMKKHFSISVFSPLEGQFATVFVDITERKQVEKDLRQNEEKFRSVLENTQDVIYRQNAHTGRFEYVSPSAMAVLGYAPDELMALNSEAGYEMVHPEDVPIMEAGLARLEETGKAEIVYRQRAKDGSYHWLSNRVSLIRDIEGQQLYRDGNIREVPAPRE
jgi:PAS domain S-box-containing protein